MGRRRFGWSAWPGTLTSPLPLSSGITIPANTILLGSVIKLNALVSIGVGGSATAGINVGSSALLSVTFGPSQYFLVDAVMMCSNPGSSGIRCHLKLFHHERHSGIGQIDSGRRYDFSNFDYRQWKRHLGAREDIRR